MTIDLHQLADRWASAGVLLGAAPSHRDVDIELLLIDTARGCPAHPRLFPLAVTWLVRHGIYVAVHRLKRLAHDKLDEEGQAILGLLIETAIEHGAPRALSRSIDRLTAVSPPAPLFAVDRGALAGYVEPLATATSKRWGRWVQPIELKPDALRTPGWILQRNPGFARRAAHKGDLRTTILETLERDLGGSAASESDLARRCHANLPAVRAALADLALERPELKVERRRGRAGSTIRSEGLHP
jgi:hypothetical protein